jgi:TonB-dependent receptor
VAGVPLSGVAGLRWVRTAQTLKGYSSNNGVVSPAQQETTRTDLLPSLSLKASFTPKLIGRLVAGKTIERPAFNDYNPGLFLTPPNANQTKGTGNAGNPNLQPTESTNVDAAVEWFFARTGSLTATAFEHQFKNRLATSTRDETYNGVTYAVSRLYNLDQAKLHGFEISYRQFYDSLPGWMSGFGLEANYTQMSGSQTNATGGTGPFLGQSKQAYNLVGMYEKHDVYARLAYNWRSKFLAEYPYRTTGRELWVAAMSTLDMSLGYNVNKNLTVSLDVTNLLNQAYHDYFDKNPSMVRDVRYYDRNIALSLRWKL